MKHEHVHQNPDKESADNYANAQHALFTNIKNKIEGYKESKPLSGTELQMYIFELCNAIGNNEREWTMLYNTIITIADEHPVEAGYMLDAVGQNGQMIPKGEYAKGMAKLFARPCSLNSSIYTHAVSGMNYINSFYPDYDKACVELLDFTHEEKFAETAGMLLFLNRLASYSKGWSFSKHTTNRLETMLANTVADQKENYLLGLYATMLHDRLERKEKIPFNAPFILLPDTYAYVFDDGLYIARPEDKKAIEELAQKIATPHKDFDDIRQQHFQVRQDAHQLEKLLHHTKVTPEAFGLGNKKAFADSTYFNYLTILQQPKLRDALMHDFHVELPDLTLPEQLQLINYIASVPKYEVSSVGKKLDIYGLPMMRSFLSVIHGGKAARKSIMAITDNFSEPDAKILFEKYSSLVSIAQDIAVEVQKIIPNHASIDSAKVQDALLVRGKDLILKAVETLDKSALEARLDRFKEELILASEVYKNLAAAGTKIHPEDIKGMTINILGKDERLNVSSTLWAINKMNRPFIEERDEIALREIRFEKTLNDENTVWYALKHNSQITAFCSFEPQADGTLLVESLNVETEIKGNKLGGDFFKTIIEKLGREKTIIGYVHFKNRTTIPFYESLGFISEPITKDGKPVYKITRITDSQKHS